MRHAAQCVGRVLRGKTDYGLMVFVDKVRHSTKISLRVHVFNSVLTLIGQISALPAPTNGTNFQSGLTKMLWMLRLTFPPTWPLLAQRSF
jgi:hypothetical protein